MSEDFRFVVVPANPFDTSPESLDTLLAGLREHGGVAEVRTREERGYGVTFVEVIVLYLGYLGLKVADKVHDRYLDRAFDMAESAGKKWWVNRRLERKNRPATLLICDEDGNVLRSFEYRPDQDAPVLGEAAEQEKRLPVPPPAGDSM